MPVMRALGTRRSLAQRIPRPPSGLGVHSGRMTVGIMGLGYVGLPLAVAFAEADHDVVAVDVDARKVEQLTAGRSYVEDVPSQRLHAVGHRIEATTQAASLRGCE